MITKTVCSFQHMFRLRVLKLPEKPFGLHGLEEKIRKMCFNVFNKFILMFFFSINSIIIIIFKYIS